MTQISCHLIVGSLLRKTFFLTIRKEEHIVLKRPNYCLGELAVNERFLGLIIMSNLVHTPTSTKIRYDGL